MSRGSERRRWPVGHDDRRMVRKLAAEEREDQRASRSDSEQMALLKSRPGESKKERTRLAKGGK